MSNHPFSSQEPDKQTSTITTEPVASAAQSTVASAVPGIVTPAAVTGRQRDVFRVITKNPKVTAGSCIVGFFLLVALFGPFFIHVDPNALSADSMLPPSPQHWFGTTQTGQDVFAQVVVGTRSSILWGFLTGLVVTTISVLVGLVAGYFGGWVDDTISLITNVFLVLPSFPLAIVLAAFFPVKGSLTIAAVIMLTSWAYNSRVLRAQTMTMRSRDFIEAARASGEYSWRLIFMEILPNEIAIVTSGFIGTTVYVILTAASLEFLGLGNGANNISWGTMLYWAQNGNAVLEGAWWWFLPPGLCIAILGAGLSLMNYGIDEVANPRLRKEPKIKLAKAKKVVA
ncbi:ABC transporter permease [Dictyobacter kobayashii]|uniref:Peptide ABC transporter permease n=1 Tax=Dictyobacter kobayashii TaxID=2014872 RepID=A0A402AU92_9CHLR|nr:ABC transporter permease [Dictyobacter kobayashii]GCE22664.1 peptide ABC transporter permease [Dictyobacter kobayashii]